MNPGDFDEIPGMRIPNPGDKNPETQKKNPNPGDKNPETQKKSRIPGFFDRVQNKKSESRLPWIGIRDRGSRKKSHTEANSASWPLFQIFSRNTSEISLVIFNAQQKMSRTVSLTTTLATI